VVQLRDKWRNERHDSRTALGAEAARVGPA
jgi:hypothetical protein